MSEMKKCLVCGKEFKPCNTCVKGVDDNYNWRRVVCCKEHFYYHIPIIEYIRGAVSKSKARYELTQAIKDYGEIEYTDNIKSVVNEIMTEEKKSKKFAKNISEVENTSVDSYASDSVDTVVLD